MTSIAIAKKTHSGRVRQGNEDRMAVLEGRDLDNRVDALLIVADGMGGERGGNVAAELVTQTLPQAVYEALISSNGHGIDSKRLLREGLVRSNVVVRTHSMDRAELRGMGTTCVAALVREESLTIGHAGDSRAYLLRHGELKQLTQDHSEVWEQVLAGRMTREQARKSRFRNVITRGIGISEALSPEVERYSLEAGDTLLLCSDGLTIEVPDEQIQLILASSPTPEETCERLVQQALDNGGSDNVTVVVMRYGQFKPLTASELTPLPVEENSRFNSEDDTDTLQDWRSPGRKSRSGISSQPSRQSRHTLDETDDEDEEEFESVPPSRLRVWQLVSVIMGLLLLAELVFSVMQFRHASPSNTPPPPVKPAIVQPLPTDIDLDYRGPRLLFAKPVQSQPLLLEKDNSVLVVSSDRNLIRVLSDGGIEIVGPAGAADSSSHTGKHPGMTEIMALDASGNRYQYSPQLRSIEKYNRSNIRVKSNIGKGTLTAVTALAADGAGNLLVIDGGRLKRLDAIPAVGGTEPPAVERQ